MRKMIKILSVLATIAFALSMLSIGHGEWFPPGGVCP
jgi:hypothetical protein